MKNLIRFLQITLVILCVVLVFAIGFQAGKKYDVAVDEKNQYVAISYSVNEQKMRRLMSLIDNHYVEDVNTDSLVDNTIEYVLSNLDPHSVYLDNKKSKKAQENMNGEYTGIGIEVILLQDTVAIKSIASSSPNKDLLKLSDKILSVGNTKVNAHNLDTISQLIRGKENTNVALTILRDKDTLNIYAKRGKIYTSSVPVAYMLKPKVGYIKLDRFSKNSAKEFHSSLLNLKKQGMQSLVLDLRGNPGGLMVAAEEIADEFLTKDKLIVFTKDRDGKKNYRYATEKGDFENKPLVILLDEGSASASEIVAGAVQDNDAGVVVGRRSYGKGLVQREISLGDGTKLRLTTAHYYTPTGRSIQKPYNHGKKEYANDLSERFKRGEMFNRDSIILIDSLKYKTPKGRTVYGGGGIIPDVFIPIDTINLGKWFYERAHGSLYEREIFNHFIKNKAELNKMSASNFILNYDVEDLAKNILAEKGLNYNKLNPQDQIYLKTYLKGQLGKWMYGDEVYSEIWSREDPMILEAIKQLNE